MSVSSFDNCFGNRPLQSALLNMIREDRIPQTILLAGPEGCGKATFARRFAAELLGDAGKIEQDDQSLPENVDMLADREKLPSDKRAAEPLLFNTHPDFVTFPPDGPLRQISIQQMRLLKERAQFGPLKGKYRVFLIDHIDRANEQAANSLLKITEEPPDYLVLILTAENFYDLLPTIRSRSVIFHMTALSDEEMAQFAASREWNTGDPRITLAAGSPGRAVTQDLEALEMRRQRMFTLLAVSSGQSSLSTWVKHSESIASSKTEKLDFYLQALYSLLEDLLLVREGMAPRGNPDLGPQLAGIASNVSFAWIEKATARVDELVEFARRNIQKGIALDAFAVEMRSVPS